MQRKNDVSNLARKPSETNVRKLNDSNLTRKPSEANVLKKSPTAGGKLPVADPTSFWKFARLLIMHVCRRILLIDIAKKLIFYMSAIILISVVTDHYPLPRSYFSDKRNVFNQYFVKLGWGWTCSLLGAFVYLTSNTYCAGNWYAINRHLMRLAFGTAWWFVCVRIFDLVQDNYGFCASDEPLSQDDCLAAGRRWLAFEISGHTFLLIHCLIMISEEARCINGWERIEEIMIKEETTPTGRFSVDEVARIKSSYASHTPLIRLLIGVITLLSVIWEVMLLATVVYFHNLPQKVAGATFAIVGYLISYRLWYRCNTWTPGRPGCGIIKYNKDN